MKLEAPVAEVTHAPAPVAAAPPEVEPPAAEPEPEPIPEMPEGYLPML